MKKKVFALAMLMVMVTMLVASCTHHTCPAYRGSIAMAEVAE